MRVIVFRHIPFEGLHLIAPALAANGLEYQYADLFRDPALKVDWESAAGLIFMGGPMSANDELPYIPVELDIIKRAVAAGKPVLGICLGAQLIARALGARVYRNPVKEIGWAPVWWREEAAQDPLFAGLNGPENVFHWHGETFDLPAGAEWLAYSRDCRHQAFRKNRAWGLQFHLEVTPETIVDWCTQDANQGDVRELTAPIDPTMNSARLAQMSALVFGRWAQIAASPCKDL